VGSIAQPAKDGQRRLILSVAAPSNLLDFYLLNWKFSFKNK